MKRPLLFSCAACACLLAAGERAARDWPMWGGAGDRNMVSSMSGAPATWDVKTRKNVKWMAKLGSQTYGNPVVAGGQVYVGTNNDPARNRACVRRLAELRPALACFGHGPPLRDPDKLADFVARLPD